MNIFSSNIDQVDKNLTSLTKKGQTSIPMTELPAVIDKLEEIADSDLGSLFDLIKEQNAAKIDLPSVYGWITLWSNAIWNDRKVQEKREEELA